MANELNRVRNSVFVSDLCRVCFAHWQSFLVSCVNIGNRHTLSAWLLCLSSAPASGLLLLGPVVEELSVNAQIHINSY